MGGAGEVVEGLNKHGCVGGAEDRVGQITSVRDVVHAKVEPEDTLGRGQGVSIPVH